MTDVALGKLELSEALQRSTCVSGRPKLQRSRPRLSLARRSPMPVCSMFSSQGCSPDPESCGVVPPCRDSGSASRAYDVVIVDSPPVLWVGDALTPSGGQADRRRPSEACGSRCSELRRILDVVPARARLISRAGLGGARAVRRGRRYACGKAYEYRSRLRRRAHPMTPKLGSIDESQESARAAEREARKGGFDGPDLSSTAPHVDVAVNGSSSATASARRHTQPDRGTEEPEALTVAD